MEAFLAGFAIAVGINFIFFPVTSRTVVFKEAAGYISACQGVLNSQASYLQSLEKEDMFDAPSSPKDGKGNTGEVNPFHPEEPQRLEMAEAAKLRGAVRGLSELHGKLSVDLAFAKREMAYGNLSADDIDEMYKLFRKIFLPLIGMSSAADIFERVAEKRGWTSVSVEGNLDEERKMMEKKQWNEIMKTLHSPFEEMTKALIDGLQHTSYKLKLSKAPKRQEKKQSHENTITSARDVEAHGSIVEPGENGFAAYLSKNIEEIYERRKITLSVWCKQKGIELDVDNLKDPTQLASQVKVPEENFQTHQSNKRQLYLILYVSLLSIRIECSKLLLP